MTLNQAADQLYNLSLGGYFNRKKFTVDVWRKRDSLRVAIYVRVSTDDENRTSSFELQINAYKDMVEEHEGWELVGIYADV